MRFVAMDDRSLRTALLSAHMDLSIRRGPAHISALFVLPYTAVRIAAEEKVLREALGERYLRYAERVPALIPFRA